MSIGGACYLDNWLRDMFLVKSLVMLVVLGGLGDFDGFGGGFGDFGGLGRCFQ